LVPPWSVEVSTPDVRCRLPKRQANFSTRCLDALAEDHPETKARLDGFRRGLEKRGWFEGRNIRIDYRFAPAGTQAQVLAKELISLQPDVIVATPEPA
jgi:hypothetical protein